MYNKVWEYYFITVYQKRQLLSRRKEHEKRSTKDTEFLRSIKSDPFKWNIVLLKALIQCNGVWSEDNNKILVAVGYFNIVSVTVIRIFGLRYVLENMENLQIGLIGYFTGIFQMTLKMRMLIVYKKKLQKILAEIWYNFLPIKADRK